MVDAPLFVVGPSRSGTTLMAACLRSHRDVWIGPETHYFDDLRLRMKGRETTPLSVEEREQCERYFDNLMRGYYGTPRAEERADRERSSGVQARTPWFDVRELRRHADESGDGSDAYFCGFCRYLAHYHGRAVWGEKTPRHVYRIDEILERFPAAKLVCTVRDPRAVVASYRHFATQHAKRGRTELAAAHSQEDAGRIRRSYHPALQSMLWRSSYAAGSRSASRYGLERVRMIRYEDFVAAPDRTLRDLAEWIGIEPDGFDLSQVRSSNSSFGASAPRQGIGQESVERWRTQLPPADTAVVQHVCRGALVAAGYDPADVGGARFSAARLWASLPLSVVRAYLANRSRIKSVRSYLLRRIG